MTQTRFFRAVDARALALFGAISFLLAAPTTTRAEQFVLFDVTFTYTKDDADNSKPSKSHDYEGAKEKPKGETPDEGAASSCVELVPDEQSEMTGRIAFVRGRFADRNTSKIWTMRPDGSNLKPLTKVNAIDEPGEDSPAWSPNGRRIAYSAFKNRTNYKVRTRQIFIRDGDGDNEICVTSENAIAANYNGPTWSADGKKIAYYGSPDNQTNAHIWVMNADGADMRQLTTGDDYNWAQCWAPDGRIVFEKLRDGNREIYVMEADGSNPIKISRQKDFDHAPACSIPGGLVAFTSGRYQNLEICVMNLDGTGLVRLTNDPARDSEPCWSADGKWIAFTRSERGKSTDLPMHIYTMKADGSDVRKATRSRDGTDNWGPSWSPIDGTLPRSLIGSPP